MQHSEFYTEEELIDLYKNFIRKQVWSSLGCRTSIVHNVPENGYDNDFEDLYMEACMEFVLALRMCNDFTYPLKPLTIGFCRTRIYSRIYECAILYRRGVRHQRKDRAAKGTQFVEQEDTFDWQYLPNASMNPFADVEFKCVLETLPELYWQVADGLCDGEKRKQIAKQNNISIYRLNRIIDELGEIFGENERSSENERHV